MLRFKSPQSDMDTRRDRCLSLTVTHEKRATQPATRKPWANRQPTPTTRAVTCRGSKSVLTCVSLFLPLKLACASVCLKIGGVGRERFRPANMVRNRAGLQIYPLPLPRARITAEKARLGCCLDRKWRRQVHQQSPVVRQMGDWCGFPKHKRAHHTNKQPTNLAD